MINFFRKAAKVFFIISFFGISIGAFFILKNMFGIGTTIFAYPFAELVVIAIYSTWGTFLGMAEDTEEMREELRNIKNELASLKKNIEGAPASTNAPIRRPAPGTTGNNGSLWVCQNCGTTNKNTDAFCKDCGEYK